MNRMNEANTKLITTAAALCMAAGLATAQQVKVVEKVVEDACETAGETECQVECEIECEDAAEVEEIIIEQVRFGDGTPAAGEHVILTTQPESKTKSHMVIVQKTDDDEFKVEINGDDVKAWVNGKRVPRKQLKVTDKEIRILDEDGDTITEFGRGAGMVFTGKAGVSGDRRLFARTDRDGDKDSEIKLRHMFRYGGEGDDAFVWEHGDGEDGIVWETDGEMMFVPGEHEDMNFFQPEDTPPVMVGINMGSLDSDDDELYDLLDERDLDEEDVIQVINVIEGLPADKAGLREGDVIVRLDGKWGANPEILREVLMKKEPGDKLEVAVVRNGRFREIDIKLGAYNAEKLGAPAITYLEQGQNNQNAPFALEWRQNGGDANKWIEELTQKLAKSPDMDADELRVQIESLIAKNLKSKDQFPGGFQLDVLPRMRGMAPGEGGGPQRFLVEPGTRNFGSGMSRDLDARIERLESRIEQLESMNERLVDRIDRLIDALERNRD